MLLYCHQGNIPRSLYFYITWHVQWQEWEKRRWRCKWKMATYCRLAGSRSRSRRTKMTSGILLRGSVATLLGGSNSPENANLDEIKCTLEHGVLTVTVPKKRPSRLLRMSDTLMWCSELWTLTCVSQSYGISPNTPSNTTRMHGYRLSLLIIL